MQGDLVADEPGGLGTGVKMLDVVDLGCVRTPLPEVAFENAVVVGAIDIEV